MRVLQIILIFSLVFIQRGIAQKKEMHDGTYQKNNIDSIGNFNQIEKLLFEISDEYKCFKVNERLKFDNLEVQKLCDSLKAKPWVKADFDQDGYTDIVVVGKNNNQHAVICIFGKGNNKFEINSISNTRFDYASFPVMQISASKPTFDYYYFKSDYSATNAYTKETLHKNTLVYNYGGFIEKSDFENKHKIEKIEFSTLGCGWSCPLYKVAINSDRSAMWSWDRKHYNEVSKREIEGNWSATLVTYNFSYLNQILNYIDFENIKDAYSVPWTDDASCEIKITYDNGKVKKISDYGMIGTFGLQRVYKLLFNLWSTQEWQKKY